MSFRDIPSLTQAQRDMFRSILARLTQLERAQNLATGAVPSGTVAKYAGSVPPAGWVLCDGSAYDGNDPPYALLWTVVGTTYGGTGITNFHVPTIGGTNPINVIKL